MNILVSIIVSVVPIDETKCVNCWLVSPNLWTSCMIVSKIIIWICKLIQHDISTFFHLLLCIVSWPFNPLLSWCKDNFGTICLHSLDSLCCWIFRHNQLDINIKHGCYHCQSNSSISTRRLNQLHTWFNLSSFHSLKYHIVRSSILNASSWVLTF